MGRARRNRPYALRLLPEERREQLLDIALEIISSDGLRAVSIDAVARRAGVTRPVVYSQFTSTDDMLCASLDREEHRAIAQLADAVPGPGNPDVPGAFRHLFDVFLSAVAAEPHRWRAIFTAAESGIPAFSERVDRARAQFVRQFAAALSDTRDPELLAHHVLAVLWESGQLLLSSPGTFPHARLLRSLDPLLATLVAQPRKDP